MILPHAFYLRPDILTVAKELLGKTIVTYINGDQTSARIVETEAYKAPEDKGSHAYNNLRTKRTETMYAAGGVAYVYLCYGIHEMFNVVTSTEGEAHAILIRAVEPISGLDIMKQRRNMDVLKSTLTNGPGKFTIAQSINRSHNGVELWKENSPVQIIDNGHFVNESAIITSPRVGIAYANECAHWPWRFRIRNSKWTSKPDVVTY